MLQSMINSLFGSWRLYRQSSICDKMWYHQKVFCKGRSQVEHRNISIFYSRSTFFQYIVHNSYAIGNEKYSKTSTFNKHWLYQITVTLTLAMSSSTKIPSPTIYWPSELNLSVHQLFQQLIMIKVFSWLLILQTLVLVLFYCRRTTMVLIMKFVNYLKVQEATNTLFYHWKRVSCYRSCYSTFWDKF